MPLSEVAAHSQQDPLATTCGDYRRVLPSVRDRWGISRSRAARDWVRSVRPFGQSAGDPASRYRGVRRTGGEGLECQRYRDCELGVRFVEAFECDVVRRRKCQIGGL